jgi:hypothetical protein
VRFSRGISGISCDAIGDLYVCDYQTIRKIDSSGNVTTVVGDHKARSDRVDGDFEEARFSDLFGLVIDGEGNLIVSDGDEPRHIRLVDLSARTVSTITGHEESELDRDHIDSPFLGVILSLSLDWNGDILIPDVFKHRLRIFPHSKGLSPSIARLYEPSGVSKLDIDMRNLCLNASTLNFDVTFVIGETSIHAHSCILMNRCDYFKAMFNAGMKEQIGGRVTIEETTPEAFQAILLYLYTGNPDVVSEEVVLDLLRLADQYLVGDLYRYCVNFMERHLCKENFSFSTGL